METLKLVRLDWLSQERDKHIWEDLYEASWDEIIGHVLFEWDANACQKGLKSV